MRTRLKPHPPLDAPGRSAPRPASRRPPGRCCRPCGRGLAPWISPPNTTIDAEAGRGARAGQRDRVEQVGRAVGAAGLPGGWRRSATIGASRVVSERAQHRQLLERVGAGGDHHPLASAVARGAARRASSSACASEICGPGSASVLGLRPRTPPARRCARSAGRRPAPARPARRCIAIVPPAASSRTGRLSELSACSMRQTLDAPLCGAARGPARLT